MSSAVVRFALGSLFAASGLVTLSAAHAGVIAGDATYTYPFAPTGEMVNITLNVTEQVDGSGGALVSGSPRPVQLVQATSTESGVMVMPFRNCINISFVAPGPSSFSVMYSVIDGTNPGPPIGDTGILTFVPSSTQSYASPEGTSCGDGEGIPNAQADIAQTLASQSVLIPVLDNDFPQGHVVFAQGSGDNDVFQITTTNGGTAIAQPDNQILYIPAAGFVGSDTFTYILEAYSQPGFELLNPGATVTVMVANPNGPPPTEVPPQEPNTLQNAQLRINGGTDTTVADSDGKPGQNVSFSVVETLPGELADIVNYAWFVNSEQTPRQTGPSALFSVALSDSVSFVRVVATDTQSMSGMLSASVTVLPPPTQIPPRPLPPMLSNAELRVNGGTATTVADSDQQVGESVLFTVVETLAGELSDIVSYEWFVGGESTPRQSGPSAAFTAALPDGVNEITVVATDTESNSGFLATTVFVASSSTNPQPDPTPEPPPAPPQMEDARILVNGGTKTDIADGDLKPGESVLFTLSVTEPAGLEDVVSLDWFVGKETQARQSGLSPEFKVALPDGVSVITLVGRNTSAEVRSLSVTVTVAAAPQMLSELGGLQPNQMGVAGALDRMCRDDTPSDTSGMTEDQQDALARCQAIARSAPADQMRALEELSGMDFNGSRTQTLLFTKSTYSGVSDRLGALRGGARGVSLRGLNIIIDGKSIPLAELERFVGHLLGGGASADDEPDSLLGGKWGFWTRGNMTIGTKSASSADRGFKADQLSLVSGLDYRISNDSVLGGALSFGTSNVAYNPIGEGGLDTKSWALTLYGTTYALRRGYLDVSVNVADSSYASHRRINYNDSSGQIDRDARGKTGGLTMSASMAGGYDLAFGGLSLSPNGSIFFSDSGIDGFRERGAGGLDLAYEDQKFESLTATLGLRINYAVRLPFGVLMPYFRGDYVRELESKVAIFNVRFANDMDSDAAPITVQSDTPDRSYWRLSSGMSTQLPFGFAGYIEYQRLESFQFVDFEDLAVGLRMQARF